jgi:hypothetical protein
MRNNKNRSEKIAHLQSWFSGAGEGEQDFHIKIESGRAVFTINGKEAGSDSDFWNQLWDSLPAGAEPQTIIDWGGRKILV